MEPRAPAINQTHHQSDPSALELLHSYLRVPWVLGLSIAAVTFLLYSGTLAFQFVWDDGPQIVNNPIIRTWTNLPRAFGSDLWYHVARHQVYYRPAFVAWSMLNYTFFGLRPWGWHLGAILLHIGAVLAVFWLAWKLSESYWTAALACLIFTLHPIHIEAVAWVSAASDSMVAMLFTLAFVAFINWRDPHGKKRVVWLAASMALLFTALLTKEMAVTFPILAAVYVWIYDRNKGTFWKRVLRALSATTPYTLITAAYVLLRHKALVHATGQFDSHHGITEVLRTLPLVLAFYLKKLLLPVGLTGLYYTPYVTDGFIRNVLVPLVMLAGFAAVIGHWSHRTRNSTIAFGGWWLLIALAPALYLRNFANGDFVRDRYMYLPSIGFAILLAQAIRRLPEIRNWGAGSIQGCGVAALCLFYCGASIMQQAYWADNFLVAVRGVQLYPQNPYANVLLSAQYSERGAYEPAIRLARAALEEDPGYAYSMLALAEANVRAKHLDEGRKWLDRFVAAAPEFAQSLTGKASLAGLYGQLGETTRAFELCNEILSQEPNLYSAVYNCGNIQFTAANYGEAEHLLSRAISLEPLQAGPKHFLGRALMADGRNSEALPYLQAATILDPAVWDYHYWFAKSLEQSGNVSAARMEYQRTLRLNQDSNEAKLRLAALGSK